MSVVDDGAAESGSFYEIGQYKSTVKRIDDGLKLCGQLMNLVKERGEIEAGYAKALEHWSKRWTDIVEKSPEYGTIESATKGVLEEAAKRCDLHRNIQSRLTDEIFHTIKIWSKDNYHKSTIGNSIKESKELEESFKKTQKPWAKMFYKVEKLKKEYHSACKSEKTAIHLEKNAQNDSSVSVEQLSKLTSKVDRCREEKDKTKDAYLQALEELNKYNPKYMEEMMVVFERCQEFELKRLRFFKEMLQNVHNCLDLSNSPRIKSIYEEHWSTVQLADPSMDLKWWAHHYGPSMPMNWPEFQEYSPKLRPLNKKERDGSFKQVAEDGITLRRHVDHSSPASSSTTPGNSRPAPPIGWVANPSLAVSSASQSNSNQSMHDVITPNGTNPYEEDWDSRRGTMIDTGEKGVTVRALYDYEQVEGDELTFRTGDTFEKLEDEDDLGWCKGRINGRVGLFPANYVEVA